MSGEQIVVLGTVKVLASSGAMIPNGAVSQANTATYDVIGDGLGFPDGVFAFSGTFATAPAEGMVLAVFARSLSIDGSLNTEVPEAGRPGRFIGNLVVNDVTSLQAIELMAYDLPYKADYYIYNSTGQTLSAGWTLKVKPRTLKAAS